MLEVGVLKQAPMAWSKDRMKSFSGKAVGLTLLSLLAGCPLILRAQTLADKSASHALSDLSYARLLLQRPDGAPLKAPEARAAGEIDRAMSDIKKSFAYDLASPKDHPPVDPRLDWPSRLRLATDLVNKAHGYVAQEIGSSTTQSPQRQTLQDIDKARRSLDEAIHLVE
jgi:hypothetical protein